MGKYSAEDFLAHYGIHGQKWGVRRFQNMDRTWTEAGKIRYGRKGTGRKKSENIEKYGGKTGKNISKDDDPHQKKGDVREGLATAALIALDVATMNPVGLANDITRLGMYAKGKYDTKKYDTERAGNENIDKKTGFKKKNIEYTPEQDIKRVNPEVNNFNSNTKSNCMLCTSTYELRRRGYDVRAGKASVGYDEADLKKWFPGAQIKNIQQIEKGFSTNLAIEFGLNKKYAEKVIQTIEKTHPNGARGNLMLSFGAGGLGGRHSVAYEIHDGKMRILDGQIGRIYKKPSQILSSCSNVKYARLDNVAFDPKAIKECCS